MNKDPFKEYIKESEPDKRDKGYAWHTAIGLQAVDGLKTSEYLVQTAVRNIKGEISFEEANALLQSYYEENPARDADDRTEEADKVSARIATLLSEKAFSFTPNEYLSIHRKLFNGIYSHAGCIRDYNITKKEWVLNGATVLYGSATELRATLDYDFSEEKKFSYKNLTMDDIIHHLAVFVSRLWQIHVFGDAHVIIGTRLEKPSKINGFALLSPNFFMPERGERNHHTSTYIAGQQYESLIAIKATIPSFGDGFEGPKSL